MLVASLDDLKPIDYRAAFPQTSFSANGPSDEFLADMGYVKVNVFRQHNSTTEKLIPCKPVLEDGWVYTVTIEPKTKDELDADIASQAASVRAQRNKLLTESDWTQINDSPVDKAEWAAYRQSLRDISTQDGFPLNVVWPNKPE